MSGCLSWSSSSQGGVSTGAIMSWGRKQVQQVDKTSKEKSMQSCSAFVPLLPSDEISE